MSKMIQIRNVPDALHRRLKARAAQAGMSLSEYLLQELRESASRPTPEEFLDTTTDPDARNTECVGRGSRAP